MCSACRAETERAFQSLGDQREKVEAMLTDDIKDEVREAEMNAEQADKDLTAYRNSWRRTREQLSAALGKVESHLIKMSRASHLNDLAELHDLVKALREELPEGELTVVTE